MEDITQIDKNTIRDLILFETPEGATQKVFDYLKERGFEHATLDYEFDPDDNQYVLDIHANGKCLTVAVQPAA